jgi:MFS family permease
MIRQNAPLLFFLSGFSALVYQVLWMRLLALVFDVTIHAASTVLAAFMAGLALGSAAAGRLADRVRRPLVALPRLKPASPPLHWRRRSLLPASKRSTCGCIRPSTTGHRL